MTQWNQRRAPLPPDWDRRRVRVFRRDTPPGGRFPVCRLAFEGVCTVRATEVDHIDGNDDHRLVNLQAVCSRCHEVKTREQSREGIRRRKAQLEPRQIRHPGLL